MKKLVSILLCVIIMALPVVSLAATPELIGSTYTGNANDLFDILNPDSFSTTTTISTCIVTAAAHPDSNMAIYIFDEATQLYRKITTYFGGVRLEETVVGASGLYAQQVLLKEGLNKILVYAQHGSKIQTSPLEITLVNEKFTGNIKSFISGRFNWLTIRMAQKVLWLGEIMKKESIKTIVLSLLIISSIILALNNWIGEKLWSDGYNFFSSVTKKILSINDDAVSLSGSLSKEKLALPKSLIINNLPKRGIYYESSVEYDKMIDTVKDILISALSSESFENSDSKMWNRALQSKSVFVSYPVVYDVSVISDILGIGRTNLDIKTVQDFVIEKSANEPSKLVVHIKDSDKEYYRKCVIDYNSSDFDAILSKDAVNSSGLLPFSFELNFDKKAVDSEHQKVLIDPYVSLSITNTIYDKITYTNPIYTELSKTYNSDKIESVLKKFGFNTNNTRNHIESDNSIVYVENYGTLKIFPTGLVEYKAISPDKGIELSSVRELDFITTFTSSLNFVTDLWNSVVPGSEINLGVSSNVVDKRTGQFTLKMNYYHDGILIRDDIKETNLNDEMTNAVEITVQNGRIVKYRQNFRTYIAQKEKIENGSTIDALDLLFNDASVIGGGRIKDIYPAYTFENGECTMGWMVKSADDKTALLR